MRMGCDIHGFIEVKIGKNWYVYDKVGSERDYTLFGILAGVRDERVAPVSELKGVPEDASIVVKAEVKSWEGDGHSHTWLSATEMKQAYKEYVKIVKRTWLDEGMDSSVYQLYLYGDWDSNVFADVRMVIWFDN